MGTVEVKSPKINGIDKWEVEDAARTLARAAEIEQQPKLLAAAKSVLAKQYKGIRKVLERSEKALTEIK